jgi:hypothetical protein
MKEKVKTIYYCEHCNKRYLIKTAAIAHEKACMKNPDNYRKCFDCTYLTKADATHYYDTYIGEQERTVEVFKCLKLDIYLYPPDVEAKKKAFYLNKDNDPMKKECESFKSYKV